MTPAGKRIAEEIERLGPIPFRRFMEIALYEPGCGYYRRPSDPFGAKGDFYTAEQLQPVFGILIAARIRQLFAELGEPPGFRVIELGAGRGEMSGAFGEWDYVPVDLEDEFPSRLTGVVFSNEFFDALPVHAAIYRDGAFREQLVACADGRFTWQTGGPVGAEVDEYLRRYFPAPEEGRCYEANLGALEWLERASLALESGFVLTIDYGFTRAESVRFPAGTLMGYRRHTARENVLQEPGLADITAHVNFTALLEHAGTCGLRLERFESLALTLLAAGEGDQFAAALGAEADLRRRMQLKTLLFGMGETFRTVLWRRM
jgi:SAM-dependent MidA family methyltransferase